MKERDIVVFVLLSIITCGIYLLVWAYTVDDAMAIEGNRSSVPSVAIILLCIFVPSAGYALLGVNAADNIEAIRANRGLAPSIQDNKMIWIILGIFIPIVSCAMIQNEINNIVRGI